VGGFEPEFAPASDVHLWLKLLARSELAWVPEPRCYLRLHAEHDHGYAYEAEQSVFLLWKDMARRAPDAVDARMLRRALEREGRHHLLYACAYLLRGDVRAARRLVGSIRPHAPLRSVLPRFLVSVPAVAYRQALRAVARRSGRAVVYDPEPRPGPRLREPEHSG
jgi:hypothetical protein